MRVVKFLLMLVFFFLAGCEGLIPVATPELTEPLPTGTATSTLNSSPVAVETQASTPTPSNPSSLRIWLPPVFDPAADTPAGRLLQGRLEEFRERRPDIEVEVRVKAETGPGGLYEALSASTVAAQAAMPDLIALPHPLVQVAAINGLLRPMNGLTNALDDPDWYDYARQLANLQNSIFGIPFAGDMLIQVYPMGAEGQPARNWNASLETNTPLVFPAGDPQGLITLALYEAAGGEIVDSQGRPTLQVEPLTKVLNFYQTALDNEIIQDSLTQLSNDQQAWEVFETTENASLLTWASRNRSQPLPDTTFDQVPTEDGKPFSLASGWVWSLTSPDPNKRQVAVELAEFLTESVFLARWSEANNFLPPRPSALARWNDSTTRSKVQPIITAARLYPAPDVLNILGPALQEATLLVLKRQLDPITAAQAAANRVNLP